MAEIPFPKLKYKWVEIRPGQHHTENPGFAYVKVADAGAEAALAGGPWYDTPAEALKQSAAEAPAQTAADADDSPRKTEEWPTESEKRKRGR
jgi:hypothetical protein